MNQEEKGKRYDWLLGQYRQIENRIRHSTKMFKCQHRPVLHIPNANISRSQVFTFYHGKV